MIFFSGIDSSSLSTGHIYSLPRLPRYWLPRGDFLPVGLSYQWGLFCLLNVQSALSHNFLFSLKIQAKTVLKVKNLRQLKKNTRRRYKWHLHFYPGRNLLKGKHFSVMSPWIRMVTIRPRFTRLYRVKYFIRNKFEIFLFWQFKVICKWNQRLDFLKVTNQCTVKDEFELIKVTINLTFLIVRFCNLEVILYHLTKCKDKVIALHPQRWQTCKSSQTLKVD